MGKNASVSELSECIIDSLLLLLQDRELDSISVKDIVEKAGVNRSTYYRNFSAKRDVIRQFYALRLDAYLSSVPKDISAGEYLCGMFRSFLRYKKELIMLDRHGLSFLLLEEMNSRISQIHGESHEATFSLYCNYHMGGVFNSFRYWLYENMATSPENLAQQCLMFLPKDFHPQLLRRQK